MDRLGSGWYVKASSLSGAVSEESAISCKRKGELKRRETVGRRGPSGCGSRIEEQRSQAELTGIEHSYRHLSRQWVRRTRGPWRIRRMEATDSSSTRSLLYTCTCTACISAAFSPTHPLNPSHCRIKHRE